MQLHKIVYQSATVVTTVFVALAPATAVDAHHRDLQRGVHVARMPDCEDVETPTFPCVTKDEDTWRIVKSVDPYRYTRTRLCVTEDEIGSRIVNRLPCVWDTWSSGDGVPSGSVNRRWMVFFRGKRP